MQKSPVKRGFALGNRGQLTDFGDIRSLRAFLTLNDFEFNLIALGERLESGSTYGAEMDEYVGPALA
jgi:hypothetical protein